MFFLLIAFLYGLLGIGMAFAVKEMGGTVLQVGTRLISNIDNSRMSIDHSGVVSDLIIDTQSPLKGMI